MTGFCRGVPTVTTGLRALALVLLTTASPRFACASDQSQYDCYPVRPGDTAAEFALRLTGSAENRHERWFRIVDTDVFRIVPKSEYGYILPGWEVCIARAPAGAPSVPLGVAEWRTAIDHRFMRWAAPVLVLLAAVLAWLVAMQNLGERQAIVNIMKRFGERFVVEFEEPLFPEPAARRVERPVPSGVEGPGADHPVRSRLRFAPYRDRLEILLAPHDGRTYPNLSDHRRNLEYDIERVLDLLGDAPFTSGQLYAEGRWVVIPFHLKTDHGSPRPWDHGPLRM